MKKGLKIARAARRARVSRETIYAFLRRGLLRRLPDGTIDPQELVEVFPLAGLESEAGNATR